MSMAMTSSGFDPQSLVAGVHGDHCFEIAKVRPMLIAALVGGGMAALLGIRFLSG